MSYKVDHNEPIQKLIERLEREHRELDLKLDHVLELSESGNLRVAESTLRSHKKSFGMQLRKKPELFR